MRRLNSEVVDQILQLRRSGRTYKSIASALGITLATAFRYTHPGVRERKRKELRLEILAHYGRGRLACVRCGEARLPCLSLDHIGGGGRAHKRALRRRGNGLYALLKCQGFPEGYQTLCMNCQFIKRSENHEYCGIEVVKYGNTK